jgi:hypothetical protein
MTPFPFRAIAEDLPEIVELQWELIVGRFLREQHGYRLRNSMVWSDLPLVLSK